MDILVVERCNNGKWRWHCYDCGEHGKKKANKSLVIKNEHFCGLK